MKQLQKENHKKGAAKNKIKKRTFGALDKESKETQKYYSKREKKRIKLDDEFGTLSVLIKDYLFFVDGGDKWRRAIVLGIDGSLLNVHYMGCEPRWDETLSIQRDANRISIYKPSDFYSEATITSYTRSLVDDLEYEDTAAMTYNEGTRLLERLCLPYDRLFDNDFGMRLIREKIRNVKDEMDIAAMTNEADILQINLRKIAFVTPQIAAIEQEREACKNARILLKLKSKSPYTAHADSNIEAALYDLDEKERKLEINHLY